MLVTHISVILPTFNRLQQLKSVIAALEEQSVAKQDFDVHVVCDGSTDGTLEYLQRLQTPLQLSFHYQANQGAATARNLGLAQAQGRLILFIDDDIVPTPTLIEEHHKVHELYASEYGDKLVVLGPMITPTDFAMKPWVRWEQDMLTKQYDAMLAEKWQPTARQFYTGNASVARRHLLEAGGFDASFRRAEDVELAYRLARRGLHFVFHPQAVGYHYAERTFKSWQQTPYQYGRNDIVFARDKGEQWLLPKISTEFHSRHRLIRLLTKLCLSRRYTQTGALRGLALLAAVGNLCAFPKVSSYAYSGMFNLYLYQGMADELGGRHAFYRLIEQPNLLIQNFSTGG